MAIASVLAMQMPTLLLDEPTANFNPQGRSDLIRILRSLLGTILFATHDLSLAFELTDRAFVLKKTKLYSGDLRTLLEDQSILNKASLDLPPLCKLIVEWRKKNGKKFAIPLTVDEALNVLDPDGGMRVR